jgi:methylenetetrahydrofolate dehydrogenase (NADP+)/methenyltetrahydrofolate cyclohydrolase
MELLDGKVVSRGLKDRIAAEVAELKAQGKRVPFLVAVLVGDDDASKIYVANKDKACQEGGFGSTVLKFPADITEEFLLKEIDKLNKDPEVDGFIVQLPLPDHINESRIIEAIDPRKDVDGFHPTNTGRMVSGLPSFLPATPCGILELLKYYNIDTRGKHCVVIGRSNIVGRPMANLLSQKGIDCTVTICHSRTLNLAEEVRRADIVVSAVGSPRFVTADMIKPGAVVVDVGMNRLRSDQTKSGWKLVGDVDFENVAPKCGYITPVPGGVGLMTISSLIANTLRAYKKEIYAW